jgi:hypothetical protein
MLCAYEFSFALQRNLQFTGAGQSHDTLKSCTLLSKSSGSMSLRGSSSHVSLVDNCFRRFSLFENSPKFKPSLSIVSFCPISQNPWRRGQDQHPGSIRAAQSAIQVKEHPENVHLLSGSVASAYYPIPQPGNKNEHIARSIWILHRGDITFEKPSGRWSGLGDLAGWQQ